MLLIALFVLVLYVVASSVVPRRWPSRSTLHVVGLARDAWYEKLWADGPHILLVQTYRNWLIGLNVLASAALVLGLGALSFAVGGALEDGVALTEVASISDHASAWRVKLVVLGALQLAAFANFLLAVRGFNRAAILVAVPHEHEPSSALGKRVLRSAHLHHSLAVRILCLSLPVSLWIFGPQWFLAASIGTVWFLGRVDFRWESADG